ncbi:MAG: phosphoribosylglycinamide formyltransferase, partial [Ilumatobacteraceae bacterium]
QAIINACQSDEINGMVVALVTNNPSIGAVRRAQRHNIPTRVVTKLPGESRQSFDSRLAESVSVFEPNWVVLAGFMRILSDSFISRFVAPRADVSSRIMNLHPASPGELPGMNAIERAFAESQTGSRVRSGAMVHFVDSEGVDCGPLIVSEEVSILDTDTLDDFAARMHRLEHKLLVLALRQMCARPPQYEVSATGKEFKS